MGTINDDFPKELPDFGPSHYVALSVNGYP